MKHFYKVWNKFTIWKLFTFHQTELQKPSRFQNKLTKGDTLLQSWLGTSLPPHFLYLNPYLSVLCLAQSSRDNQEWSGKLICNPQRTACDESPDQNLWCFDCLKCISTGTWGQYAYRLVLSRLLKASSNTEASSENTIKDSIFSGNVTLLGPTKTSSPHSIIPFITLDFMWLPSAVLAGHCPVCPQGCPASRVACCYLCLPAVSFKFVLL